MHKVFCFGELLLRLSPALGGKWIQDAILPVYIGGAELNVASALAAWNMPVKYCTVLPDHYLSREIISSLQTKGIDTSTIQFSGNRIGLFYLPQGADLKSTGVIYDRAHSAFSELKPGRINWDQALNDCSWFHFTAINPALNENIAAVCKEALDAATRKGLVISIDLNYRPLLWKYGKIPADVMPDLVSYCHIIMGNIWSVESLLGISSGIRNSSGISSDELREAAEKCMQQMQNRFPRASSVAFTFRMENEYWAILQQNQDKYISKKHFLTQPIDKAGSGDCFMGGLIYGFQNKLAGSEIINFAASAAVGKLQEKGDSTHQSVELIKSRY